MTREIPLSHPGIILLEDWLKPRGISQYALAKAIDVPARRINEIVKGLRGITVDTALRLGAYFGTDAQSWINLQTYFDTENAREAMTDVLKKITQNVKHSETT
jgi:antitoxin HigA-1